MRQVLPLFSLAFVLVAGPVSADTRPGAPIPSPTPAQVITATARPLAAEAPPSAWQHEHHAAPKAQKKACCCCKQAIGKREASKSDRAIG